ncbi:MAG: DUF5916 domain-containing protein [Woeseia sp.]
MRTSTRPSDRLGNAGKFLACLAAAVWSTITSAADAPQSSKVINAVRTQTAPMIDGDLSDPEWQRAAFVDDLHEVSPDEYSETSEPSRFYVLYDENAIYVAGKFWDSNPDHVIARILRKGDVNFGDETSTVLLDPHNNGRSGYMFDLNPNGVRNEALFSDVTKENWAWQGIWNGAANKDDEGWVAEFEIPFKSLSFDPTNDTWGINFMRWRARSGEYYGWVSYNGAVNPANSGKLLGLVGMQQGTGLDVVPGIRADESKTFETQATTARSESSVEPSLDVFYKLTPALTAALTVNTDFSGTGADARQINLTRFGLFFPERRDFFLQDTDIFEFGRIGGSEPYFPTTFDQVEKESGRPFFSRRIGLSDSGEPIDLDVGAKLTGRVGRWEIGILDIQQASHASADSGDLFVGRAALNVLAESMLGVIFTRGDPLSDFDNTLVGVDFRYLNTRLASGSTLEGAVWYQRTDSEGVDGDDAAFGVSLKMPDRQGFRGGVGFKELQDNYYPALGFVNRVDVRDYTLEFGHTWIPDSSAIRRVYSGIDAQRTDTTAGALQSEMITIRALEIETPSSEQLMLHYGMLKEQIITPFEISEGIFIQPGLYSFDQYCISTGSGEHRSLSAKVFFCDGDFFNGEAVNVNGEMLWRPGPHFKLFLRYDVNDIELPQGNFVTRLASMRADIAFTSTWYWENFVQYDNVSDSLGLNSILRWLPRAGREMVLVVNREFQDFDQRRRFKSVSSEIAFKFSYTFRF